MTRLWKLIQLAMPVLYNTPPSAAAALAAPPAGTPPPGAPPNGDPPPDTPPTEDKSKGTWFEGFKNPELKSWMVSQNNGIPDAEGAALKAWNLERLLGADKAGRGIIIPKPEATEAEWADFYRRVGVPDKPEGYTLPKDMDSKAAEALTKDPMLAKFQAYAHSINMPPQFFGKIMSWFAKESATMLDTRDAEYERQAEADVVALKQEWPGDQYAQNVEHGRRAAKMFIPHNSPQEFEQILTKMEGGMGTALMFKVFANIGKAMAEDKFVETDTTVSLGMSKEAAISRIAALKGDKDWQKRWMSGGASEKAEWDRLHKIAYGS